MYWNRGNIREIFWLSGKEKRERDENLKKCMCNTLVGVFKIFVLVVMNLELDYIVYDYHTNYQNLRVKG